MFYQCRFGYDAVDGVTLLIVIVIILKTLFLKICILTKLDLLMHVFFSLFLPFSSSDQLLTVVSLSFYTQWRFQRRDRGPSPPPPPYYLNQIEAQNTYLKVC